MVTRKELEKENQQLRARLGAAAGETRKGLRERVKRLAAEVDTLKKARLHVPANYEELKQTVDAFFGDTSRSRGATREGLEQIREEIGVMLDTLRE